MKRRLPGMEKVCYIAIVACLLLGVLLRAPGISLLALLPTLYLLVRPYISKSDKQNVPGDAASPAPVCEDRRALLRAWVHGEPPGADGAREALHAVGIEVSGQTRALTQLFRLDAYGKTVAELGVGHTRAVQQALLEACEAAYPNALCCTTREDNVLMLLLADALASPQAIAAPVEVIRRAIWDRFGMTLTVGIGTYTATPERLAESIRNADMAARYRLVFGPGQTIAYENIQMRIGVCPPYEKGLEASVVDAFRKGDVIRLEMALPEFFEAVCAQSVTFILPATMRLLVTLYAILPRARQEESDLPALYTLLESGEHYGDYMRIIKGYALANMQTVPPEEEAASTNAALDGIQQYVHENVGNPDLCLVSIAENTGLSANTIRTLLREHLGTTPRDLIQSARMQRAQALLRTSDMTAKAIGEAVGYRETRYFYNVFKKHTGLTTYEYRSQSKDNA